jgi:hypothetical protein
MAPSLEETLISVWREAMAENAQTVTVGNRSYPVRRTSRSRLREVDFESEGQTLRGLEQNPNTGSTWARLVREGKKVMQFLVDRRYVASVVDGKVQFYGRGGGRASEVFQELLSGLPRRQWERTPTRSADSVE